MIRKLTQEHVSAMNLSGLPSKPPMAFGFVSQGQMSIARYYGGMKFQGKDYTYLPEGDQLVRDDVLKWLNKQETFK